MLTFFLHGFATTPEIWRSSLIDKAPELAFNDINLKAKEIGEGIGKGAILIGWSMGGMMAISLAAQFPEKIKGLVLVSTTPKFLASADWEHGLPPALLKKLTKRIKVEGLNAFHQLAFKTLPVSGLVELPYEQVDKELNELARIDLRGELAKIKAPTLIIHGDQDEICLPTAAKFLQLEIGNCLLELMKGVGHAPFLEQPEEFERLIKEYVEQTGN